MGRLRPTRAVEIDPVDPRSHEIAEQRDAQHAERDEETKHPSFRIRRQHTKLPVKRMTLLERRRPLLFLLGLHIHSKFLDLCSRARLLVRRVMIGLERYRIVDVFQNIA